MFAPSIKLFARESGLLDRELLSPLAAANGPRCYHHKGVSTLHERRELGTLTTHHMRVLTLPLLCLVKVTPPPLPALTIKY